MNISAKQLNQLDEIDLLKLKLTGIIMKKTKNCVVVLVEGEKDKLFYRNFFSVSSQIESVNSSNNRELIRKYMLHNRSAGQNGIIAIIDNDYDWINTQNSKETSQLFYTDVNDLETMLLSFDNNLINKIIFEYFSDKTDQKYVEDMIKFVTETSKTIGLIRIASKKLRLNFDFKRLNICDYIVSSQSTFIFNRKEFIKILKKNLMETQEYPISFYQENFSRVINLYESYPWLHVSKGHDITNLLNHFILNSLSEKLSTPRFDYNQLEYKMLKYVDVNKFTSTRLYSKLRNWEQTHNFKLFAN